GVHRVAERGRAQDEVLGLGGVDAGGGRARVGRVLGPGLDGTREQRDRQPRGQGLQAHVAGAEQGPLEELASPLVDSGFRIIHGLSRPCYGQSPRETPSGDWQASMNVDRSASVVLTPEATAMS